jgi:hypothetical protein
MLTVAKRVTKPVEPKKPSRTGRPLHVWLPNELMDALDAYVDRSRPRTSAKAITQMVLEDFLRAAGLLPPSADRPAE